MGEARVRAGFEQQAVWCRKLGGPFTARVCEQLAQRLDRTSVTGTHVLDWDGDIFADALMLRLVGGLNALVRSGKLPALAACYPPNEVDDVTLGAALAGALLDHHLVQWLGSAPQTNEVARSGVLMPGPLVIAAATGLPLRLLELGASAGLNLRLDRYRYALGGRSFGPAGAAVELEPEWEGPPPPIAEVRVEERRGVDLNPIDVRDAAARERLLAYVWPEQSERIARLEAALAAAAADPPQIDSADAAGWVEQHVHPRPGVATVVFHSIAFQYFPAGARARIAAHMEAAGAAATAGAPLAWLRFEFDGSASDGALPTLRLRLWPGGEDRLLAHAHPHGASVQWLG